MNSLININQRYKSSTRIDYEYDDFKPFIDDFVLHGTAANVLDTISRDYSGSAQRAYTLTGPYGSGKSTIALFLTSLLSSNIDERSYATQKLLTSSGYLSDFGNRFNVDKGWQVVKHVCGLESPAHSILISIYKSLNIDFEEEHFQELEVDECLSKIEDALGASTDKDGTIIFLDEMGKALDYLARNNQDLHLFQSLADIAQKVKTNVLIIGFLHQSFSDYAKNKDAKAQNDWAKVQGRYRDLAFNPSIDESLILIGESIQKRSDLTTTFENKYKVLCLSVLGYFKTKKINNDALLKTLPIDPVVSLLLGPISRRKFSQNERSLFGFLASHEKLGFREFLEENYSDENLLLPLYQPEQLWDYLHFNLHHVIVNSHDSKAWLEGCDAINRAEQKGDELHVAITKLIALLTIFGFQHHLHAKREFIVEYFKSRGLKERVIQKAIKDLESWSVIIFRQNHNALFIFQGSDIDIHNLVVERIEAVSHGIDWTSACNIHKNILATAHYHKTGTMRWANTKLVSSVDNSFIESLKAEPLKGASLVTFVIPVTKNATKALDDVKFDLPGAVIGKQKSFEQLKSVAVELIALIQIAKEEGKIEHDLIAQKELETRMQSALQELEKEYTSVFSNSDWSYLGKDVTGDSLSQTASNIADKIYSNSPVIINELLNRSKPSGSANAALKKLLSRMVENYDEENLGFDSDTFPPEKGLYLSCLVKKGLHNYDLETELGFFSYPEEENDLKPLFDVATSYLKENQHRVVYLSEIYQLWSGKPFGVVKGILPLWCLAYVMANTDHLSFYDKDVNLNDLFIAHPDEEFAFKLYKEPSHVGVKYIEMDGVKLEHLSSLANALNNGKLKDSTLKLAQEYVKFISHLSPWTKKTVQLSKLARGFRDLTLKASDPTQFLIEDIPALFKKHNTEIDADKIGDIINELRNAHVDMVKSFKGNITKFVNLDVDFVRKCKLVADYTSDYKLQTFAMRLSEFGSNEKWVSSIISLLSGVAERNWDDMTLEKANSEIVQMMDKFRIASHYAVVGSMDSEYIDSRFSKEVKQIKATLRQLDQTDQRSIVLRLLEDFKID